MEAVLSSLIILGVVLIIILILVIIALRFEKNILWPNRKTQKLEDCFTDEVMLAVSEKYNVKKAAKIIMWIYCCLGFIFGLAFTLPSKDPNVIFIGILSGIIGYALGGAILCLIIWLTVSSYDIVITDKRIYARTMFGFRKDLPIDSVCAVSRWWFKSLMVKTDSAFINFSWIKNRNEMYETLCKLMVIRQNKPLEVIIKDKAE